MGARQVGKTSLILEFAKQEYQRVVYLNFDENNELKSLFEGSLSPDEILKKITIYFEQDTIDQECLIFFDEVQECPEALNSLKYFCEKKPEISVIAAGSLLGVQLASHQGFPVGKVNFLELFPMSFFEFLNALEQKNLLDLLLNITVNEKINEAIHNKCLAFLKEYLYIGGMPAAVKKYVETKDINKVANVHKEIINGYMLDFSKHTDKNTAIKIKQVWESIPTQLAKENKKFIFNLIRKGARAREYEHSIEWMENAGIIYKQYLCQTPKLPIKAYCDHNFFKVYLLDVGLLGHLNDVSPKVLLSENALLTEYKGSLIENFVLQELKQKYSSELFYWTSNGKAEVDLIMQHENAIYPLEIKAGSSKIKKSLILYNDKYNPPFSARASQRNLTKDGNFINYPLYLISRFPELQT